MLKQIWIALKNRGVVGSTDAGPSAPLNMTGKPALLLAGCTACGACVKACPVAALRMAGANGSGKTAAVPQIAHVRCIGCARCVEACLPKLLAFLPGPGTWQLGREDEWQSLETREEK